MKVISSFALDSKTIEALPDRGFSGVTLLVVGDLMLDRYLLGEVTRISPEAPVPVVAVQEERFAAGGAANVALNVAGLRAKVIAAGVVGDDFAGHALLKILTDNGVSTSGVLGVPGRPTTCKTRVMCGNHQIVRLDNEVCQDVSQETGAEIVARIEQILNAGVDAVILSDYAKGALTLDVIRSTIKACGSLNVPVFVDPKRNDYAGYAGAACITPNQREFTQALETMSMPAGDVGTCAKMLRDLLGFTHLLVTQGANGMTIVTGEHTHHFPALAEEVFDVSGAGDTVIATLGTCLAAGLDVISAVQVANAAASIVVRHAGTVPIKWEELYERVCCTPLKQTVEENRMVG